MLIQIEPESSMPIYEQLELALKRGIVSGELAPGEMLPSVRSLASDIGINLHTVNKAYKNLAEEGILIQAKKGFQVNTPEGRKKAGVAEDKLKYLLYELTLQQALYDLSTNELEKIQTEISQEIFNRKDE